MLKGWTFSTFYPIYVINMKERADKWTSIQSHYENETLTWSEGIDLNKYPNKLIPYVETNLTQKPRPPFNWRQLGGALSHFNVWQKIATDTQHKISMVLEDDSLHTESYQIGLHGIIETVPGFHMVNLCTLRPTGTDLHKHGLLKVNKNISYDYPIFANTRKYKNMWTDAYLLSRSGAIRLLESFKRYTFDMSKMNWDQGINFVTNKDNDFERYVVKDSRYFRHACEKHSDRQPTNNYARCKNGVQIP